jgi:hypothetical protein
MPTALDAAPRLMRLLRPKPAERWRPCLPIPREHRGVEPQPATKIPPPVPVACSSGPLLRVSPET